jgi:hypothetical protein
VLEKEGEETKKKSNKWKLATNIAAINLIQ